MEIVYTIVRESWQIYLEVSVFMLFGFFVAALLHVFFKTDTVHRYFGEGRIKPVFLATLLGIPIPL